MRGRCPITYQPCPEGGYSKEGLTLLSPHLKQLHPFPYSEGELLQLALEFSDRLSFSGVQKKLNARLSLEEENFKLVPHRGSFLLKPPSPTYPELPQNEDLTMKLAHLAGIETPLHGLLRCVDGSLTYFVKRFDRKGRGEKVGVEDFSQIAGVSRETKYDFSMEKIVPLLEAQCTFPELEKEKFFRLALFSFLVGNEDLHLKNLSLIRRDGMVELSPAYDLVNSAILLKTKEELALPLRGKKSRLNRSDWIDYFGKERLALSAQAIGRVMGKMGQTIPLWIEWIEKSFLSSPYREAYSSLLQERAKRLF